jgi:integrase
MKMICYVIEKNLAVCSRDDIDDIVRYMHSVHPSYESKKDFIKNIKHLWRLLFPERDDQDRIDETVTPYPVRHLSANFDKSRNKMRKDKLTLEEFESILNFFSDDAMMQCYLATLFECLVRPQELCFVRIEECEIFDEYATVTISDHGKEGPKKLLVVDSFPYFISWYNKHPLKGRNTFLFLNEKGNQLLPGTANKRIKIARKRLGIRKPITNYSLKRSGVTVRRLRGDSDTVIQHIAGWTSTRQLKTYDLSDQDDVFKLELAKRGIIKDPSQNGHNISQIKVCSFCQTKNGFTQEICQTCKRPLDRERIRRNLIKDDAQDINELLKHPEIQMLIEKVRKLDKLIEEKGFVA